MNNELKISPKETQKQFRKKTYYKKYGFTYDESSLSRVWQHSKNGGASLSAFDSELDEEENLERHEELKSDLKAKQLGYFEVDGIYTYTDNETGKEETDNELSVFIPFHKDKNTWEQFEEIVRNIGQKNEQESVLIIYPKEHPKYNDKSNAYLVYTKSGRKEKFGKFFPDVVSAYYLSRLKKGSHKDRIYTFTEELFSFKGVRVPQNYFSAMGLRKYGIIF